MLSFDIQSSYYLKDSNLSITSDPRVGSRFISINNNHDFVIVYQPVNEATNLKEFTTRKKYLNWWARWDSNPHAFRHKFLRLACISSSTTRPNQRTNITIHIILFSSTTNYQILSNLETISPISICFNFNTIAAAAGPPSAITWSGI